MRNALRKIVHFYQYKTRYNKQFLPIDREKQQTFLLIFLLRVEVESWPWQILETHFHLFEIVNIQTVSFETRNTLIPSKRFYFTHRKLQSDVRSQPHSFLNLSFSKRLCIMTLWHAPWLPGRIKTCSKILPYSKCNTANVLIQLPLFKMERPLPHSLESVYSEFLRQHFTNHRIINRVFPTTWPSRSPDLNLWFSAVGLLKKSSLLKKSGNTGIFKRQYYATCEKHINRPCKIHCWTSCTQNADFTSWWREPWDEGMKGAASRALWYECMDAFG